jgi:hypothetical protein
MSKIPIEFQDFCKFYKIRHYGNKQTYNNINSIWKLIHKKMQTQNLLFPNFEMFINYLKVEHDSSQPKFKFIHWYIINEFYKYQANVELYFQNFQNYNKRLIGYSNSNNCHNMRELKQSLHGRIKRIKADIIDDTMKNKSEFLIMARYICDYLEDFPEEIPKELFNS